MNGNKISIIVPVYKVPEKFLRRCIESLINQTFKNIEIILVDDGSPDNCGEICDSYQKDDDRIKVIHQKNKGLSGARNTGVYNSTSDWLSFVDGDDFVELDMYEKLYNAIEPDVDIICCCAVKDYGKKIIKYDYSIYENNKKYTSKKDLQYMRKMLLNFNGNNAWAAAKLIKKELIKKNSIYHDEKLKQGAEGLEFNIRLFYASKGIKFIKEYGYHYMFNDSSITTTHNEENHNMVLKCFEKIKNEIECNDNELMNYFYNRLEYVIITTAISGYFSPVNKESYNIQRKKYENYLNNKLIKECICNGSTIKLDIFRKMTLFFIKNKMFLIVKVFAYFKYFSKRIKSR